MKSNHIFRAYKVKLHPTEEQAATLAQNAGASRWLWNSVLGNQISHYEKTKEHQSSFYYQPLLPQLKEKREWLKDCDSTSLQFVLRCNQEAWKCFFKTKKGFPKFKTKQASRESFTITDFKKYRVRIDYRASSIKLGKHGFFKANENLLSVPKRSKVKRVTISKDSNSCWYASILVEEKNNYRKEKGIKNTGKKVGVDLGLKDVVSLSIDKKVRNPKFLKEKERRLAHYQRVLSRCQKGSSNRERARRKVALAHFKIKNSRRNFHHRISIKLVKEFDTIVFEFLNVKGMVKSRNFSKAISDASWSQLVGFTTYKAIWAKKQVMKVNPRNTSKTCNECGAVNRELRLSQRSWKCPDCGSQLHRDYNAARNILDKSLFQVRYQPPSGNSSLLNSAH